MGKCLSSQAALRRQSRARAEPRERGDSVDGDCNDDGEDEGGNDDASLEQLFRRYEEPHAAGGRAIRPDGVAELCDDLGLDPEDARLLLLAWLCDAKDMCTFTRSQFRSGCRRLRAASVRRLRAGLDSQLASMTTVGGVGDARQQEAAFKELYAWTFDFGLEAGQRALTPGMAADLWGLVFAARAGGAPAELGNWLRWLRAGRHGAKVVTRDTWQMFLTFCDAHGSDLAAYDHNEAWPSLIDEFVEAETDRANQNLGQ